MLSKEKNLIVSAIFFNDTMHFVLEKKFVFHCASFADENTYFYLKKKKKKIIFLVQLILPIGPKTEKKNNRLKNEIF